MLAVVGVAHLLAPLRLAACKPDAEVLSRAHGLVMRAGEATATWPSSGTSPCCSTPAARPSSCTGPRAAAGDSDGDPVGQPSLVEELLWQFRERCDEHDVSPVFYQVSARYLPVYLDLGLIPFKLGEEAIVDLPSFDPPAVACATCARVTPRASGKGCASRWWPR